MRFGLLNGQFNQRARAQYFQFQAQRGTNAIDQPTVESGNECGKYACYAHSIALANVIINE